MRSAVIAVFGLIAGVLATLAWRRTYLRDVPLSIWGRDFPSGEAAVRALAEQTKLEVERQPEGLTWIAALFLAPIWFIWGDLRTRRPERHLARWRLRGASGEHNASILLSPDRALIGLACAANGGFSVELDGALANEEGLRSLHPVGGERWQKASTHIDALKRLDATRLRFESGRLEAELPLDGNAGLSMYAATLRELEALAVLLESS